MFEGWKCTFTVYCDDELVDAIHLEEWLHIAGQRIGLGDWMPAKSGHYGRFEVAEACGTSRNRGQPRGSCEEWNNPSNADNIISEGIPTEEP